LIFGQPDFGTFVTFVSQRLVQALDLLPLSY
jgi:hypothetical protein